ncbi:MULTISPECIES: hypothetical protein [unclassified Streptomyces]|uniref:hypothetical protein n=1 Tax=unclassified Streptomyces TaxID=2593676 RepID=UPI000691E9E0|nr:hypothetical protein [Streptomyces sp. NRRL F-2747]
MTSAAGPADFHPTHVVPREGLPAWEGPDLSRPTAALDPFLPVQLLSRRGEWGEILCANGWSAWVDGRLLVPVPEPPPPTGGRAPERAEDPLPLLAHAAGALERYRQAAADLASGRTGTEEFRRATRGLRAGIVVDGESVWLYEEAGGRWMYGDATGLVTYAVGEVPGAPGDPEPSEPQGPQGPQEEPSSSAREERGAEADVRADPARAAAAGRDAGHEPTRIVTPPEGGGR